MHVYCAHLHRVWAPALPSPEEGVAGGRGTKGDVQKSTAMRAFIDVDQLVAAEDCSCQSQLRAATCGWVLGLWQKHEADRHGQR